MNRQLIVILSLVALVAAFLVAGLVYRGQQQAAVATQSGDHSQRFEPAHAMRLGDPAAKVVIVEFFDPACETCAQFAPILKAMVDQNPGKVQLVERYAPFHDGSETIVAMLEASRRQDKYWQTLDIMFATQAQWASHHRPAPERLWAFLEQGGIDIVRLAEDARDPAIVAVIQQDLADAKVLGVTQTPEFFVNGKPLPTWGLKQLQDLVQSELEANY